MPLFIANLELLFFLCFYYFILGSPQLFKHVPFFGDSQTLSALFSLVLYLIGIAVFHLSFSRTDPTYLNRSIGTRWTTAILELRMLLPFALPFLIFTFLSDFLNVFPSISTNFFESHKFAYSIASLGLSFLSIICILIFLPVVIQKIWQCKTLDEGPLRSRLEALCSKAQFRYADIKTWTILNQSLTAAIIGIAPKFRYIIFTKRLLNDLPAEEIEVILAHEIGHNAHRHLLIYPLIIFGMLVCAGLFSLFFSEAIIHRLVLENLRSPSELWTLLYPFAVFLPYAFIIALYFRFVFGYFSRIFERQADLYVFNLNLNPQNLIKALDYIGIANGNIHNDPNWHHYGIKERMDFLTSAAQDPKLIQKHHRKVKYSLIAYSILLCSALWILIAPIFRESDLFKGTARFDQMISTDLSKTFTHSIRQRLAKSWSFRYHLMGRQDLIEQALDEGLLSYASTQIPGSAYYEAAFILLNKGQLAASTNLMVHLWQEVDTREVNPEVVNEYSELTKTLLKRLKTEEKQQDYQNLKQIYENKI
jgi:Zn-dependent protease with chaperone function